MPAIQPARLKTQVAELSGSFHQPALFVRQLHALLALYADRTHRPGLSGAPAPLTPAYFVPPPVLRQVVIQLKPLVHSEAQPALALCDALWAESYFECRSLAAALLGQVSPYPPDAILGRLETWLEADLENTIVHLTVLQGSVRLRSENLPSLLKIIPDWLAKPALQQSALILLQTLAGESSFNNLALIYRQIIPLLRKVNPILRPDLLTLLEELAHSAPQELTYVLRQALEMADNPDTPSLIRQVMPSLPEELRQILKQALQQRSGDSLS